MTAMLEAPVTTLVFLWRLQWRDGVVLGFTTHNLDIVRDGLRYRAAPGMLPSAVRLTDQLDADTMEIGGALSSAALSAADLATGRWDGAALGLWLADWRNSETRPLAISRGTLGTISRQDQRFSAELRGPAAALDQAVSQLTSPECRAALGDRRCRVDLAARTRITTISAIVDSVTIDVAEAGAETNAYGYGHLRWIEGRNSGLKSAILHSEANRLILREPPPTTATPGTRVEIVEGCDKRFATCTGRFGNGENFRGEPHLPGNDLLTRYPGAS
jgi:uncharacterized phage protein (TIGR02218 family)